MQKIVNFPCIKANGGDYINHNSQVLKLKNGTSSLVAFWVGIAILRHSQTAGEAEEALRLVLKPTTKQKVTLSSMHR